MLVPKVARHFSRLPSTNTALIDAVNTDQELQEGDVFLTDAQTAGRGQGTNGWHSTPGKNLTFSLLLYPDHLAVDALFTLSRFTSLALTATIRHFAGHEIAENVRIKWPNDIYVADRKIAGILIQNGLRGSKVQWSVVGIGLNVNETEFPPALRPTATSLTGLCGETLSLATVRDRLFAFLAHFYTATYATSNASLEALYHDQLYLLGQPAPYLHINTGERFTGIVRGVEQDGRLLLGRTDGGVKAFELRSLRLLRD